MRRNAISSLFNFQLRDIAAIEPWGGETPSLHWFGLSDGWYWLSVGEAELFRYGQSFMQREEPWLSDPNTPPYVDYYVVRLWEDLLYQLPTILVLIPVALADRIADAAAWRAWLQRAEQWRDEHESEESIRRGY